MAVEAEALLESGNPEAGLQRAEEALSSSQAAESVIGEALAECASVAPCCHARATWRSSITLSEGI